jgi:hypothetical protein
MPWIDPGRSGNSGQKRGRIAASHNGIAPEPFRQDRCLKIEAVVSLCRFAKARGASHGRDSDVIDFVRKSLLHHRQGASVRGQRRGCRSSSGSNAADDKMVDVLEDQADDPVYEELTAFIGALDEDERAELVALTWLGRGDAGIEEWSDLRSEAARARNERTAAYLLGLPLLSEYLEEGLSQFGRSCED